MNVDDILSGIRSRVGRENLSNTCRKDGCRVSMEDVPTPRIVVDADRAFPAHNVEGKRCDYVLFFIGTAADTLVIVPMELKGGTVDASVTSEQLQGGAKFADRMTRGHSGVKPTCHPILFHGNRIHKMERKALNRTKVTFRNQQLTIKTARCNQPKNLSRVLTSIRPMSRPIPASTDWP